MVQDLIKSDKVVTLGVAQSSPNTNSLPENVANQLTVIETRLGDLERKMSGTGEDNTIEEKRPSPEGKKKTPVSHLPLVMTNNSEQVKKLQTLKSALI